MRVMQGGKRSVSLALPKLRDRAILRCLASDTLMVLVISLSISAPCVVTYFVRNGTKLVEKQEAKQQKRKEAELARGNRHVPYLLSPQGAQCWRLGPCKGFIMAFQSFPHSHRRYCVLAWGIPPLTLPSTPTTALAYQAD
jgi:hypothetical protein